VVSVKEVIQFLERCYLLTISPGQLTCKPL